MKIIIPTWKRLDRQLTIRALAPELHGDVWLAVRPEEAGEARARYPDCHVQVLPPECTDLLKTRQWLWEAYAPAGRFCMLDDDILAFERPIQGRVRDAEQQRQMLRDLEAALDAGAGVASPRTHWTPPHPHGMAVQSAADVVQFFMLDGPRLRDLNLRWDRIMYVEDQDFCLQVLSHGIDVVQLRDWSFSASSLGEGEGGLNLAPDGTKLTWGDRAELARLGTEGLAKLWPGHVRPSKRRPGYHQIYRTGLLQEAQRRLGKRPEEVPEGRCPGCLRSEHQPQESGLCQPCDTLVAQAGSVETFQRLARFVQKRQNPDQARKRGRPASGTSHPIVRRFASGQTFRASDVVDLYASRNSASVSLANMVGRGLLERVTAGVYRVRGTGAPEGPAGALAAEPPGTSARAPPIAPEVTVGPELAHRSQPRPGPAPEPPGDRTDLDRNDWMEVRCANCPEEFWIDKVAYVAVCGRLIDDDGSLTIFCPKCFGANRVNFRDRGPFSGGSRDLPRAPLLGLQGPR